MMIHLGNFLLLSLAILQLSTRNFVASANLPRLWEDEKADQFYRFFYKLEIIDNKNIIKSKSFMIEEWAKMGEANFRLDISELPSGRKRTIIYHPDEGEIFYYEPFKCYSVDEFEAALYPELAHIFPLMNHQPHLKFGVGSLWNYAQQLNARLDEPVSPRGKFDGHLSFVSYESYKYSIKSSANYDYDLSFYLSDPSDINSLNLITIGSKYRLRIIDTPIELSQTKEQLERVFSLPQGYGCARSKGVEQSPLPILFMGSDVDKMRLIKFNIVASRPVESTADSDMNEGPERWRSHSSSVRILSGGFQAADGYERNYIVFEKQQSSSSSNSIVSFLEGLRPLRQTRLRRTKVVWDMSIHGTDSRSRFFELDATGGKCLGYGETKSPSEVSIDLSIAPASSDFGEDSPPLMLTFGIELISELFSPDGFGLISKEKKTADRSEFVFEKRVDSFQIKNRHGEIVWQGPVSLIRRFIAKDLNDPEAEQQMISINFYSKKVDSMLARVKFYIVEQESISQNYLQKEIDVSHCLLRLGHKGHDSSEYVEELEPADDIVEFAVSYYPQDIDSFENMLLISDLEEMKRNIEMEFIKALVGLSDKRLDIMQIVNLASDIDSESVEITGQLLEKPKLLNFYHDPGQRLSKSSRNMAETHSTLKQNVKSCAESCDFFNCAGFSFCPGNNVCDLLINSTISSVNVEWDPTCAIYSRHDQVGSIISPEELIYQMDHIIKTKSLLSSDARTNPMALSLDGELELVPESMKSDSLYAQEFIDMTEDGFKESYLAESQGYRSSRRPREEYSLLFQDRKYKTLTGEPNSRHILANAKHLNYFECESLCKQNDCRSFSYCRLEKVCQISGLHSEEQINEMSEKENGCSLMTRDYLSKFERVSNKPSQPTRTFLTLKVDSLKECANNCMERDNPTCRMFYYCPLESARASCYLKANHLLKGTAQPHANGSTAIDRVTNLNCDLYARSYLGEFDKFYGKSLPIPNPETTASIHLGLEPDSCASECIDQVGKCIGFQVCSQAGSWTSFVCAIFSAELSSHVERKLTPNPGCTFFLASPGSELYQLSSGKLAESNSTETSKSTDSNQPKEPLNTGTSSKLVWLLRIVFISVGLALGYVLIMVLRSTRAINSIRQMSRSFGRS